MIGSSALQEDPEGVAWFLAVGRRGLLRDPLTVPFLSVPRWLGGRGGMLGGTHTVDLLHAVSDGVVELGQEAVLLGQPVGRRVLLRGQFLQGDGAAQVVAHHQRVFGVVVFVRGHLQVSLAGFLHGHLEVGVVEKYRNLKNRFT